MKRHIVGFVRWLVAVTGRLALRVLGAFAAACVALLLLILLVFLFNAHLPFSEPGTLAQVLVAIAIVVGGTLMSSLLGFIWPGPFIALLRLLEWLPDTDVGLSGSD